MYSPILIKFYSLPPADVYMCACAVFFFFLCSVNKRRAANIIEEDIEANWNEAVETFDAMGLHDNLLRGIYACGFLKPSAIQQRAIKPMTNARDIIAQAQSGTGKTATFAVGILQTLDQNIPDCQALVLAPTRELAQQIVEVIAKVSDFMTSKVHACVGGNALSDDIRTLEAGVQVLVGTPGRVYDLINCGALRRDTVKIIVLDEADELLSIGFKDHTYDVFKIIPKNVQVCAFSSTMPLEALEVTTSFMREPIRILVEKDELILKGIKQFYFAVEREVRHVRITLHHYPYYHLLQHPPQGGLAYGQNDSEGLRRVVDTWRHGRARARHHHARLPLRLIPRTHHYRLPRARH